MLNKKEFVNKIANTFGFEAARRPETRPWMKEYKRNNAWRTSFAGLEIVNKKKKFWDTVLYEESERPSPPRYLNIGAGSFYHPMWHNLDKVTEKYGYQQKEVNINMDLKSNDPIPLEDNSLKIAYTSHLIEHLPQRCTEHLFSEINRVLMPGGIFRVTCPDMDLEYDAYMNGDSWLGRSLCGASSREQIFIERFAYVLTEKIDYPPVKSFSDEEIKNILNTMPKEEALDYFSTQIPESANDFMPGAHMNWFNTDKLTRLLKNAGFESPLSSRYGQSKAIQLRNADFFDSTHPEFSLYIESVK